MRSFLTILLSATAAAAAVSPVLASETRIVAANRATGIVFHYTMDGNCYSGAKPTFRVTGGPAHGSVTSVWKAFRMGKESGHCEGTPVHGTVVIYRPNPGYHGADKVSFVFSEGEGNDYYVSGKEYIINITVK